MGAAGEVQEKVEMVEEELRLLAEALSGQLKRAEQRAWGGTAEAAAGAAGAAGAVESASSLMAEADAILSSAEQLLSAAEAPGESVAERLIWVNRTADAISQVVQSSAAAAAAQPPLSAEVEEAVQVSAADADAQPPLPPEDEEAVASVFGSTPDVPDIQPFLLGLIKSSEDQADQVAQMAAAAVPSDAEAGPSDVAADIQEAASEEAAAQEAAAWEAASEVTAGQEAAAWEAAVQEAAAEPAAAQEAAARSAAEPKDAPVTLWLRYWSAAPGFDTKAAWLQDWARAQMADNRVQPGAQPFKSFDIGPDGKKVVKELKEKVLAAFTFVVGLSDNLWPDEADNEAEKAGGRGGSSAGEATQVQAEFGADGSGMQGGGAGDDGGAGKGKGGSGGGSGGSGSGGSQPGDESAGSGGDGGDGEPPGGDGGSGGGNGGPGGPDPWDGFDRFPPEGGMDPAVVLPLAVAAAVSLAATLVSGSKRAAQSTAVSTRAATPVGAVLALLPGATAAEAQAAEGRQQQQREQASSATKALLPASARGVSTAYDAGKVEFVVAPRQPLIGGGLEVLIAADEALHLAQISEISPDLVHEHVVESEDGGHADVAALSWAAAKRNAARMSQSMGGGSAGGMGDVLLPDLDPSRLQHMDWAQLDKLPEHAQRELLALRSEVQAGRWERREMRRRMRQLEALLEERESQLEASYSKEAAVQGALEAAVTKVGQKRDRAWATGVRGLVLQSSLALVNVFGPHLAFALGVLFATVQRRGCS